MNIDTLSEDPRGNSKLRLLSYNIQVGITATRYRDYIFQSWKHFLPYRNRMNNLKQIALMIRDYDVVGLQELDSGSLRSGFINHAEYLANLAGFPHWYDKTNRTLWKVARHSMGLLSRYAPIHIDRHNLPARMPGRSALVVHFGNPEDPLVLVLAHLSLSRKARIMQMEYVGELIRDYKHVILMGDLNCGCDSKELSTLLEETQLRMPYSDLLTYPSWKPKKHVDHILVSPTIEINSVQVLNCTMSDHLPIAMEISLPEEVFLSRGESCAKPKAA